MSDNIDVPVGFTAAQGLGLEPQAQALNAGLAAVERAMAPTAAQQAVAAMRPKRHIQYVEITCLDCGWQGKFGFPVPEARAMRRIAWADAKPSTHQCPRCYARMLVGAGDGGAA